MKPIETTRLIDASISKVFTTLADVRNFSEAVPHITNVEFLTEQKTGVGTRFRETREMKGKPQSTELEVTEFVENDRVRMVSDQGGTIWDTLFTVTQEGDKVKMHMKMDVKPYKLAAKLITPLISGMVAKFVEADMDSVKVYCESN